ncbi:calcium-binding protein [Hyphococcus sp.]|uniref:calcium-binding protein n=1 Tax=Hyphococcus sp. TaxID=2038636 RepID=UPI003CCC3B8D
MWTYTIGQTDGLSQGVINMALNVVVDASEHWGRYLDFGGAVLDVTVNFVSLGNTALAQAGPFFFFEETGPGGENVFQAGPIRELQTGVDPNGGGFDIEIDINSDTIRDGEFFFGGIDDPNVPFSQFDLFTVLVHEIGHGLGILSFENDPSGDVSVYEQFVDVVGGDLVFTGPNAVAAFGGNVPLDGDESHIGGTFIDVMNAALANGERLFISPVDIAILQDAETPILTPTNGNDVLFGFEDYSIFGDDAVSLLGGDDLYDGVTGNDDINGDAGDDTLIGGAGADTLNGGADFDVASYATAAAGVSASLASGGISGDAAGDSFVSIEGLIGTAFNDTLAGNASANTIETGGGADFANSGDGDDTISGGGGDDTLNGGDGDDTIGGDAGRDSLVGGDGADTLQGFGSHDSLYGGNNDDDLRGGFGRDLLGGASGDDVMRGFEGDDRLFGGGGADTLVGNDDNDSLTGGGGVDRLRGDAGDDTLNGRFGADSVTGGAGDDLFQFRDGHGNDTYDDFTAGAGTDDVIQLVAFGAAFDTFAEVIAAASDNGNHTTIDFGGGDSIVLLNVTVADLHEDDFIFT